jgi:flagellar biosynthetic protein FlhB
MATDGSASEKTEEPTARRLQKAREEGQVARSPDLSSAVLLFAATLFFSFSGEWLFHRMGALFTSQLQFDRKIYDKAELLPAIFGQSVLDAYLLILPFMVMLLFVSVLATGLSGGFIFSMKLAMPNFGKVNLFNGLSRMFGLKAWIELAKSIAKFSVIAGILYMSVTNNIDELINLNQMDLGLAVKHAGSLIIDACYWMSLGLLFIAFVDVPLQRYQVNQRLKMSKQEVKDEMKDAEGRPEVKAQIRRRQREMANNRMMAKVKDADVVITNPQHFAVALVYDPNADGAPTLVAKGTDELARRIRELAEEEKIHIFESPELARALYFTTSLDQSIPEALYQAVAQVIAYVFSLNQSYAASRRLPRPTPRIPDEVKYDENGFLFGA